MTPLLGTNGLGTDKNETKATRWRRRKRAEKVEMNFEEKESVYYGFKIEGLDYLTWYRGDIRKVFSKKTPKGNLRKYCDVVFDDTNTGFGIPVSDLTRTLPADAIEYSGNKKK